MHTVTDETTRIIVRQSTVGNMDLCPAREGLKTVEGYVETVSEPALFGTIQHALIERRLRGESVDDILYADVRSFITYIVDQQYAAAGQTVDGSVADSMIGETVRAFTSWAKAADKLDLHPVLIEETLEVVIYDDGDIQIVLQGTPDMFEEASGWDWKTSGRPWKEGKAEFSIQAPLYLYLVGEAKGFRPRKFTYMVYDRGKGTWSLFDTYPSDEFVESALARAVAYGRVIAAGVYAATPVTWSWGKPARGWYCSERWCGAWNVCPFKILPDGKG